MRDIKFRAWISEISHMVYSEEFERMGDFFNDIYPITPQKDAIMQFTGLHDKNGKEIYEGDIVKCTIGCPHEVRWFDDNGGTYIGGMPGFNLDGLGRNRGIGYAWTDHEEVIGNIYENPELLNHSQ